MSGTELKSLQYIEYDAVKFAKSMADGKRPVNIRLRLHDDHVMNGRGPLGGFVIMREGIV